MNLEIFDQILVPPVEGKLHKYQTIMVYLQISWPRILIGHQFCKYKKKLLNMKSQIAFITTFNINFMGNKMLTFIFIFSAWQSILVNDNIYDNYFKIIGYRYYIFLPQYFTLQQFKNLQLVAFQLSHKYVFQNNTFYLLFCPYLLPSFKNL